ncbi:LEA type 2 family protein [Thalassolituus oleivorans]|uniref:LEA type 2 family protein n=1 Tax=Thalassolituus oleivorans TaxID=187493 RepID=UPI0023F045AE|nr:LEA type 2 family protein [Thalassolituus oleivorans]
MNYSRAFILLSVIFLASCSTLKQMANVQKPTANVSGVALTGVTLDSLTLAVDLDVVNPNPFAINTGAFNLDLAVDSKSIASVDKDNTGVELPAKGTAKTTLPLTLRFVDLYEAVAGLKDENEFAYALAGSVSVALPILGEQEVPLSFNGSLPIPKIPKISLKSAELGSSSWRGAEMAVVLDVTNPNVFGINLNELAYQINAAGTSVGGGSLDAINLEKGQQQEVTIPIKLSFSEIGMSLYKILTGSAPVEVGVSGSADINPDLPLWKPDPLSFDVSKSLTR